MNIQIFDIVVHIIVTFAFLKLGRTSQIPVKVSNTLVCEALQQSSMNKISVRFLPRSSSANIGPQDAPMKAVPGKMKSGGLQDNPKLPLRDIWKLR
jgi:hypothetical protein